MTQLRQSLAVTSLWWLFFNLDFMIYPSKNYDFTANTKQTVFLWKMIYQCRAQIR